MRRKKTGKKWMVLLLAILVAAGGIRPLEVSAAGDPYQDDMEITAAVNRGISTPSYEVTVPLSLAMGTLKSWEDNVREYDISVTFGEKEGSVVVEAPEGGFLYAGDNSLPFSNNFGTRTFQIGSSARADSGGERSRGMITIEGTDVASAEPGNYTGTTTFTITYNNSVPEITDPGGGDALKEGKYTVDVALWHAVNNSLSMGNPALDPQGIIVADANGGLSLQLTFRPLDMSGIQGYLYRLKKVKMDTVVYNTYNYPISYEAEEGEILKYYEGVHDGFNDPASPSFDLNTGGSEYPKVISVPIEQNEDMNYVEIYVPVMESIGAGQGTQVARLHIDWVTLEEINASGQPSEPENPAQGQLDIHNLQDGIYSVTGNMVKTDKETLSMSDNAVNHTIKLTVKNGKYYLTMNFNGLQYAGRYGYLSTLKYFLTGYTENAYGVPQGNLADVTVDSYQTDANGTRVTDSFGTDYPDHVTFELIPEALEDGYVPLQVFVPVMESIAGGTGTQQVYLKIDWSTIKTASAGDPIFEDDGNNGGNGAGSGTGGPGLAGGSALAGGSSLPKGTSLGNSALGTNSLKSGNGLSSLSSVKTGDTPVDMVYFAALITIGCVLTAAGLIWKRQQRR